MIAALDIETIALPEEAMILPDFRPHGGIKDESKMAADVELKRAKAVRDGALDALTGRIALIGIRTHETTIWSQDWNEGAWRGAVALEEAWEMLSRLVAEEVPIATHYGLQFDLPFMAQRSYVLDVPIPRNVLHRVHADYYWSDQFIDLSKMWALGRRDCTVSLSRLCQALGVEAKIGRGENFADLWATDPGEAVEYLGQDLIATQKCAERMMACLSGRRTGTEAVAG